MGMYNNVKYKFNCLDCEHEMKYFQTKDGEPDLIDVEVEKDNLSNWYSDCARCGLWHEFHRNTVTGEIEVNGEII